MWLCSSLKLTRPWTQNPVAQHRVCIPANVLLTDVIQSAMFSAVICPVASPNISGMCSARLLSGGRELPRAFPKKSKWRIVKCLPEIWGCRLPCRKSQHDAACGGHNVYKSQHMLSLLRFTLMLSSLIAIFWRYVKNHRTSLKRKVFFFLYDANYIMQIFSKSKWAELNCSNCKLVWN